LFCFVLFCFACFALLCFECSGLCDVKLKSF
jgi:hypothetical protein